MASKDLILKKYLIRDIAIAALFLVILLVAALVITNKSDDLASTKRQLNNENGTLTSDLAAMKKQQLESIGVIKQYNAYKENYNPVMQMNRDEATQILTLLKEKHHITALEVTYQPLTDMVGELFVRKTGTMVRREVGLSFSALSDADVYSFVEAIERDLPGFKLIHNLRISRKGNITNETLTDLKVHRMSGLVKAEIGFTWIALAPKESAKPKEGAVNAH